MVTQIDPISTPPTPSDAPAVFEERASQVWADLHKAVPKMNQQALDIEAIGRAADIAKRSAQDDSDAALAYRNEANAAKTAALGHAGSAAKSSSEAGAATDRAEAAARNSSTAAGRAEVAAVAAEGAVANAVRQTSGTGAAVLPEGTYSQRPTSIPNVGLIMRGSTTTGVPEYYSRQVNEWIKFGIPDFLQVPPIFCGWNILVLSPHLRYMVWSTLYNKYVRAAWHQPGQLAYFLRAVPYGYVEVRADLVLKAADFPDLAEYLGVVGTTFVLDEARGEFLRTHDGGRGIDPGRNPGSWQADEIKSHTHFLGSTTSTTGSARYVFNGSMGGSLNSFLDGNQATGGAETRGRNLAYRLAATF